MPVYRVPGGKRATVYAFADEIDEWLRNVSDDNTQRAAEETPTDSSILPTEGLDPGKRAAKARIALSRWVLLGAGVALVIALVGMVMLAGHRPGLADHVSFNGKKLCAYDQNGRLAWEHEFPDKLDNPVYFEFEWLAKPRFLDLDGDGRQELLIVVGFAVDSAPNVAREQLCCFSSSGEMLWSYEPTLTLSFAGQRYEGPWFITDVLLRDNGAHKSLWLAMVHNTWWPSFVAKLDPKGNPTVQFVNSGATFRLGYLLNDSGSFVIACGVNNEYSTGTLAVLDESQAPSASPQTPGSTYSCDACPEGRPLRYYLFPRSELNTLQGGPYNPIKNLRTFENHLEFDTGEAEPNRVRGPDWASYFVYQFSKNLDVETVSMSDGYADLHRRLSSEHRIAHSLEECPVLTRPYLVRMWDELNGWTEKEVVWAKR